VYIALTQPPRADGLGHQTLGACVETPPHPGDRFGLGTNLRLGKADPHHPSRGNGVERRKPQCLVDVTFSFGISTKKILGEADLSMSRG
jgi:hypothetical protein